MKALLKVPSMIHLSITQLFKLAKICMSMDSNLMLLTRNGVKKRYIHYNLIIQFHILNLFTSGR